MDPGGLYCPSNLQTGALQGYRVPVKLSRITGNIAGVGLA